MYQRLSRKEEVTIHSRQPGREKKKDSGGAAGGLSIFYENMFFCYVFLKIAGYLIALFSDFWNRDLATENVCSL